MDILIYTREIFGASLAFLNAVRSIGMPIAQQKALFTLYHHEGSPLSLSSLSQMTGHDRRTIRDHMASLPDWMIERGDDGYRITDAGRREYVVDVMRFIKHIEQPYRGALGRTFEGKANRVMRICEFAVNWDNMAIATGHSKSYLSAFTSTYLSGKNRPHTVREITERTTYTEQAIRGELETLVKSGLVRKSGRGFIITPKGKIMAGKIVLKGVASASPKTLIDMAKFAHFSKFPHADA